MSNLTLVKSENFGDVICDFWQNEDGDIFMTIDQLAKALGYADRGGIENIVSRNEYLKQPEFSTTLKLKVVEGDREVERERRIFTEDGIYEVTMLSKQPKAREFRAWVRKIIKSLRKGEAILARPQTDDAKLIIQRQRAEAMLLNARTRQAKLIWEMKKAGALSPVAAELLRINVLEVLTGKTIDYRPEIEKTYTATEIAEELGITPHKVGRIATRYGLRTPEYGKWVLDKARGHEKQVRNFLYNEKGKAKIIELVKQERKNGVEKNSSPSQYREEKKVNNK